MKYGFNKRNQMVAIAESTDEAVELLKLRSQKHTGRPVGAKDIKPRKRQVQKQCPICDMKVKGAIGLGIHVRKIHKMSAQEAEKSNTFISVPITKK